jgi:peptidoglycan LD-endopeptidase CwlK
MVTEKFPSWKCYLISHNMPLSDIDKQRLSSCAESIQKVLTKAATRYPFHIVFGHRSPAEQFELYKKGRKQEGGVWVIVSKSSVVTYCDGIRSVSNHNYMPARAVDIIPDSNDWNDRSAFAFLAGKIIAIADEMFDAGQIPHRLKWGGDWDEDGRTLDEKLIDYPHIEEII